MGRRTEFHQRCMLLAGQLSPLHSALLCVAGSVLLSPTGSHTQEGFFMSIEWSDWFCDTFTTVIFELLPQ